MNVLFIWTMKNYIFTYIRENYIKIACDDCLLYKYHLETYKYIRTVKSLATYNHNLTSLYSRGRSTLDKALPQPLPGTFKHSRVSLISSLKAHTLYIYAIQHSSLVCTHEGYIIFI